MGSSDRDPTTPRYGGVVLTTSVLAYLPSPDRGVWHLGPIPLRAYALCIIAGIVVAIWWGEKRFVARGGPAGTVVDVAVWAVPFGLVGGRLYHLATDWRTYFGPGGDPVAALKIWEGGLGIWGAIALGAVGAWIGCRRRKIPLAFFADAVAPGIIVAQAIGRLGNYFNQELFGPPTTLPWGLQIDPGSPAIPPGTPEGTLFQPLFLYELLWNLLGAAVILIVERIRRLDGHPAAGTGLSLGLYLLWYGSGRAFLEWIRLDPTELLAGGIKANIVTAVIAAVLGVGVIVYAQWRTRRATAVPAGDEAVHADAE